MKKSILFITVIALSLITFSNAYAQVQNKIDKATKSGNAVFLVVTEGNTELSEANNMALKAKEKVSMSEVIHLDKSDNSNQEIIKKYGLLGAQAPLILVIASNGVVCGGLLLNQASAEKLIDVIPTKRQGEALLAFNEGKAAFVVVSKKSMTDKNNTIEECKKACDELKGLAVVVDVDLDDESEASFIKLLNPNLESSKTNVLVFNSKGHFNGKMEAPVQSKTLIKTAKKVAKKECCPGGSKKGGC